jgi:hypothetical protein
MSANDPILLDATLKDSWKERASDLKEAEFFERFVAEQVVKDFLLSDDEIEAGLVGGGGDGGVDRLYFLANRQLVADETEFDQPKALTRVDLVLIQATQEASFAETRVQKLYLLTEYLLDLSCPLDKLAGTYNATLINLIGRFKDKYKSSASANPSCSTAITVTSATASGVLQSSRNPSFSRMARYSGW